MDYQEEIWQIDSGVSSETEEVGHHLQQPALSNPNILNMSEIQRSDRAQSPTRLSLGSGGAPSGSGRTPGAGRTNSPQHQPRHLLGPGRAGAGRARTPGAGRAKSPQYLDLHDEAEDGQICAPKDRDSIDSCVSDSLLIKEKNFDKKVTI